jgi:hypothetical protein
MDDYSISFRNPVSGLQSFWSKMNIPAKNSEEIESLRDQMTRIQVKEYSSNQSDFGDNSLITAKTAADLLNGELNDGQQLRLGLVEACSYPEDPIEETVRVIENPDYREIEDARYYDNLVLVPEESEIDPGPYDTIPKRVEYPIEFEENFDLGDMT